MLAVLMALHALMSLQWHMRPHCGYQDYPWLIVGPDMSDGPHARCFTSGSHLCASTKFMWIAPHGREVTCRVIRQSNALEFDVGARYVVPDEVWREAE